MNALWKLTVMAMLSLSMICAAAQQAPASAGTAVETVVDGEMTRHVHGHSAEQPPAPAAAPNRATVWSYDDATAIGNSVALGSGHAYAGWHLHNARLSAHPIEGDGTPAFEWMAFEDGSSSVAAAKGADRVIYMEASFDRDQHRVHGFTASGDGTPDWSFDFPAVAAGDSLDSRHTAVSYDGAVAAAVLQDNVADEYVLYVFDAESGDVLLTWDDEVKIWGVDLTDDGSLALVTQTGVATLIDTATGDTVFQADNSTGSNVVHHRISGDGGVIVVGGVNWLRVHVLEGGTYQPVIEFDGPSAYSFGWSAVVSRDGSTVGALGYSISLAIEAEVFLFDVASGEMLGSYPVAGSGQMLGWGNGAASSDDGSVMAFASWGTEAQEWPEIMVFNREVELIGEIDFPGSAFSVDVSVDGRYVIGGSKAVHANQQGNGGRIELIEIQAQGGAAIDVQPEALSFELEAGDSQEQTLSIANLGDADLVWDIQQSDVVSDGGELARAAAAVAGLSGRKVAPAYDPAHHQDVYGYRPRGLASAPPVLGIQGGSDTTGTAAWSWLGPAGGDVFAVAVSTVDPDIVLAGLAPNGGSGGTLYRSEDGGDTWAEVEAVAGSSVFDIEFAPDGTIYLGSDAGVRRSTDGGDTWTLLDLGVGIDSWVYNVAVDPSDPATLWAAVADHQQTQAANLLRSTDGGDTWHDRTPPRPVAMSGRAIAVDPGDSDTVVAVFGGAFGGGQVWVTTDGGDTWTERSAGLPANPMRDVVYDGQRLLVGGGQSFGSQFLGLYQSLDLGVTWTPLHDASWDVLVVDAIAVDPDDAQTILVATNGTGVHRSRDGGDSWEVTLEGTADLAGRALRFAPGDADTLFLGTSSLAVFRSTDGGDLFTGASQGISRLSLYSVAANPLDANELAIAFQGQNDGGVYSSTNGGLTWVLEDVPPTRYNAVAFAPDGTLHALSDGPTSIAPQGLYRRLADGEWIRLGPELTGDPGLSHFNLGVMRFGADDPALIVLAGSDAGVLGNEGAIWRSLDDGATWDRVYESEPAGTAQTVTDVEILAATFDTEMVAAFTSLSTQQGGVLRSHDSGASWLPSGDGLPGGFFRDPRLCAASDDSGTLYLAAWPNLFSSVLYVSADSGESWTATGWSGSAVSNDLACDPVDAQTLYISLSGGSGQVARSTDGGTSFQPFASGLEDVTAARRLGFAGGSRLLLASDQGSFVTELREATACTDPAQVPWLSVTPAAGTTPPGAISQVTVEVDSAGLAPGDYAASLCIDSNDVARPFVVVPVQLTVEQGEPLPGELEVTPAALDFGAVPVSGAATLAFEVSNAAAPGAAALELATVEVTAGAPEYAVIGGDCATGVALEAGASCTVEVRFEPSAESAYSGTASVTSEDGQSREVELSGTGVMLEDEIFADRFE